MKQLEVTVIDTGKFDCIGRFMVEIRDGNPGTSGLYVATFFVDEVSVVEKDGVLGSRETVASWGDR